MSRHMAVVAIACAALAQSTAAALAQTAPTEPQSSPVAIVLDTSGSMDEGDGSASGRIKIDGAKVALLDFLQQVEPNTRIGLRNYPAEGEATETEEGCSEGKAQFEVKARDPAEMAAVIRTLEADGDTPTAAALRAAADELQAVGAAQGTIVLVSDGESNCGRDPCEVAREIAESGIDLQTITVGFRVSGAGAKELQCIADQTGGKYLSVHDNEGLAEAFDEISRPRIDLEVSYPKIVTAQVGNDPSGLVRIEAKITNTGQRLARGAVARLGFDVAAGAPAVLRPVVHLGNLDPGASRQVAWVFRPSVPPAGTDLVRLPFAVAAGAQNTLSDAEFRAEIVIRDAFESAADAGPILSSRAKIAILGDSYSSGEGADVYLTGSDTDANPCHRSRHTYLFEAFGLAEESIVACSGAVTNDIGFAQQGRTVGSQLDQLTALRDGRGVEAVVLTLGGNDLGFGKIATSCLLGRADCSRTIITDAPLPQLDSEPVDDFVDARIAGLVASLEGRYAAINRVVNGPDARQSGRPVPILVLAYPLATPLTPQSCGNMLGLISPGEMRYLIEVGVRLNATIEEATRRAREEGAPVFFVPNTEMAFQPDHTVCSREPYARHLKSFNGAGVDYQALVDALKATVWRVGPFALPNPIGAFKAKLEIGQAGLNRIKRGINELVHPTKEGYAAETRAVLRWSQSPAAAAALDFLESAPVAGPPEVTVVAPAGGLGQLAPGSAPVLQGGTAYPVQVQGFAPGLPVEIGVESTYRVLAAPAAGADGAVAVEVGIPADLEPGDHTLKFTGSAADGKPRTVEIPFEIDGSSRPAAITALIWGGVAGVVVALLLALAFLVATRVDHRRREAG